MWIDVNKELPAEDEPVLVVAHEYQDKNKPQYMLVAYISGDTWYDYNSKDFTYTPDYWMLLPTPPKD